MDLTFESMTMSGNHCAPPIRDLDEIQRHKVYYYTLMPNMLLAPHPDFDPAEAVEFWDMTIRQD